MIGVWGSNFLQLVTYLAEQIAKPPFIYLFSFAILASLVSVLLKVVR